MLVKPLELVFEPRPRPLLGSAHEVLVAVEYSGICGSDLHYWRHGAIGHFVVRHPLVLGHESSGTVVQVGDRVDQLVPGDRVALEPGYPCRRCRHCLAGSYNLCRDIVFAATPPHDGTLTGFWSAPADFCHKLPDAVSLREGAMIEPLAVAVHLIRQAALAPGQSVAIMGAGPVGLLSAAVAKAHGASTILCLDLVSSKLDLAAELAATSVYLAREIPSDEQATAIKTQAGLSDGFDAVIEASGAESCIQTGLHLVRPGGIYVQGGMGRSDVSVPIMTLCINEITAKGSFRYGPGDFRLAIELVASGKVHLERLISKVVPFRQAEEAFRLAGEGKVVKILIAGPNRQLPEGEE